MELVQPGAHVGDPNSTGDARLDVTALQAALDLTPDSTPILVTGVDIRLRQKRFDDALELIRKVEAIDPETGAELRERLKG